MLRLTAGDQGCFVEVYEQLLLTMTCIEANLHMQWLPQGRLSYALRLTCIPPIHSRGLLK